MADTKGHMNHGSLFFLSSLTLFLCFLYRCGNVKVTLCPGIEESGNIIQNMKAPLSVSKNVVLTCGLAVVKNKDTYYLEKHTTISTNTEIELYCV